MESAQIIPFDFEMQAVRVVLGEDGQPWFVAKDVCEALGIKNYRDALSRLDDDEKGVGITDTLGGTQELLTVNESGLFALTFTSRKPQAKRFRKWVTADVLPTLRKTGRYEMEQPPASMPENGQADRLINAGRVFREMIRMTSAANRAGRKTLETANAFTQEATGLNMLEMLGRAGWERAAAALPDRRLDELRPKLTAWLEAQGGSEYTTDALMREALGIPAPTVTDYALLSDLMHALGWKAVRLRVDGAQRRGYAIRR